MRTNAGTDWLARAMGGDITGLTGTGTTAPTATTITLDGRGAPGSTTQWNGHIIVCGGVYGVITSNTNAAPPVVTVDQWYNPATGAVGTTPAAGVWVLVSGNAPMYWMALSTDATAPAATDTTLTSELTTNGLGRALATYAHTNGQSTFTLTKTFTCTGGSQTVNKIGCFNASAGGTLVYETAEPSPPTLATSDTLAQTETLTLS